MAPASTTWKGIEMDYLINFDSVGVLLECPGCGYERNESVGVLRRSPVVQCPKCKGAITFDNQTLDKGLRRVERNIEALKRNIRPVRSDGDGE